MSQHDIFTICNRCVFLCLAYNIYEMVTALYVISEIAQFKDIESDDCVMIIPYLNGEGTENPIAVLQINMDAVIFKDEIQQDDALQANRIFEVLAQERAD